MTLNRFEEFLSEVSLLAMEEFERAIKNVKNEDIFEDAACLEAYFKISLCEELGVIYRSKLLAHSSHILASMCDTLDVWECRGFYGFQIYAQKPWHTHGSKRVECEARLWVARWLLSRVRGAV